MDTQNLSQYLCRWGWGGLAAWKGWRHAGVGARSDWSRGGGVRV